MQSAAAADWGSGLQWVDPRSLETSHLTRQRTCGSGCKQDETANDGKVPSGPLLGNLLRRISRTEVLCPGPRVCW